MSIRQFNQLTFPIFSGAVMRINLTLTPRIDEEKIHTNMQTRHETFNKVEIVNIDRRDALSALV